MTNAIAAVLDIATEDEHLFVQYTWQVGDEAKARAALVELLRRGVIDVYVKVPGSDESAPLDGNAAEKVLLDPASWLDPDEHPDVPLGYAVSNE